MSYGVDNIINIVTRLSPGGLAFANFGKAMLFSPEAEIPSGMAVDEYRVYKKLSDVQVDYADTTETYKAAARWLAMIPQPRELTIYVRSDVTDSDTVLTTLGKAADKTWWYWTFFTKDVYADEAGFPALAVWGDANGRFVPNCSIAADIRNPALSTDISSVLTAAGSRRSYTMSHASDDYAGISVSALYAAVNYNQARSTITGEFKKLPGVTAESLTATEYAAMRLPTKKAVFYTQVDLQGSIDNGRLINTLTHSSFNEYIDDVVNLDAFVNNVKVALFNAIANQPTKLPQTPAGQAVLIGAAKASCEQYISNGYLGPRNYTDPDDGAEKFTAGYEIMTNPEEILDLTASERGERKSAPIRIRVFRAGAVHIADINIDVY